MVAAEELNDKSRNKIWLLRAEFEEIRSLKQMAEGLRSLRKRLVTEKCD